VEGFKLANLQKFSICVHNTLRFKFRVICNLLEIELLFLRLKTKKNAVNKNGRIYSWVTK